MSSRYVSARVPSSAADRMTVDMASGPTAVEDMQSEFNRQWAARKRSAYRALDRTGPSKDVKTGHQTDVEVVKESLDSQPVEKIFDTIQDYHRKRIIHAVNETVWNKGFLKFRIPAFGHFLTNPSEWVL